MSVNTYLQRLGSSLVLSSTEKASMGFYGFVLKEQEEKTVYKQLFA